MTLPAAFQLLRSHILHHSASLRTSLPRVQAVLPYARYDHVFALQRETNIWYRSAVDVCMPVATLALTRQSSAELLVPPTLEFSPAFVASDNTAARSDASEVQRVVTETQLRMSQSTGLLRRVHLSLHNELTQYHAEFVRRAYWGRELHYTAQCMQDWWRLGAQLKQLCDRDMRLRVTAPDVDQQGATQHCPP